MVEVSGDRDEAVAELRHVREREPGSPVIVILRPDQVAWAPALLASGADGCVLEGPLGDAILQRATMSRSVGLTRREQDVLHLLADGYSYAATATALGIGVGTVQSHVKNLYRKLGVSTKVEATRLLERATGGDDE